ncbi:VOC family protein [Streptomyces sp. NBC_00893]|uniref:VOC family protein n=1 Tax=Streptomyces sp. NBC_00893 TaxID=2975862 RepID=UPI00225900F4|nr:VOC family protein [Streptomyces sp. NBC_00893]MCX4850291.1 VOC family protein [Streptomyces sp. NBC_00893]
MPLRMKSDAITLDCPDPPALAAFCQEATGLELHPESDADFAGLSREDGLLLGFQRVDDYRAPSWPGQADPQQLHICFSVGDDLDGAEARLLELGADKPEFQPHDKARARVFTDPAGHLFCLVRS